MTTLKMRGIDFVKGQKPRVEEFDKAQEYQEESLLGRFEEIINPGIVWGLNIQGDAAELGLDRAWYDSATGNWLVNVSAGKAFDVDGRWIDVPGDTYDGDYVETNPSLQDSQVPPVAIPQSTGRTRIPLKLDLGSNLERTYLIITYLSGVDQSYASTQVRGTPSGYPYVQDAYKIMAFSSPQVVQDEINNNGASFLGYVEGYLDSDPGLIHMESPTDLPLGVTFDRVDFSLSLDAHIADENAHHDQLHSHSTAASGSGESALTNIAGEVVIGAENAVDDEGVVTQASDEARVGGENLRISLKKLFEKNGVINFRGENDTEDPTYETTVLKPEVSAGGSSRSDYVRVYIPGDNGAGLANGRLIEEIKGLGTEGVDWDYFNSGPTLLALELYFNPSNTWSAANDGWYDVYVTQRGVLKYAKRASQSVRIAPVEDLLLMTLQWTYVAPGPPNGYGEITNATDERQYLWPFKWDKDNIITFINAIKGDGGTLNVDSDLVVAGKITGNSGLEAGVILGGVIEFSGSFIGKNPVPLGGAVADTNWQICDGTNGTPDLRDMFIVGAGVPAAPGSYNIGDSGGEDDVTLSVAQMPSHGHTPGSLAAVGVAAHNHGGSTGETYAGDTNTSDRAAGGSAVDNDGWHSHAIGLDGAHGHSISGQTANEGGGASHENRPSYYALARIMRIA